MGDIMRPVPFGALIDRVFSEYRASRSIFGIPEKQFYHKPNETKLSIFGESCNTPVGPAAGPHTQLAQNIISSWLTGGRFIELKTVQKLDTLEIAKPCIDAEDECFNTEWSTEFTLPKAHDEYLKAWVILHLLETLFDPVSGEEKSFIFNMSAGYDLAGIKTQKMQTFLDDMMDSSQHPKFAAYIGELRRLVNDEAFINDIGAGNRAAQLRELPDRISPKIARSMTLSTMHGCPPDEIEAICRYMLCERQINTFVKLNPTLLGYERVRSILDQCGFGYVTLDPHAFEADLKYPDATAMLRRLLEAAKQHGVQFGVKLSNTLGTVNTKGVLPDKEMYMSGRALYPLTINVAAKLAREFAGKLDISYSGGACKLNIESIFATGIRPITMATDLLKPGGYLRMKDCAELLDTSRAWQRETLDIEALEKLAAEALEVDYTQKEWRGPETISVDDPLPMTDCYVAPCQHACAIHQDIPEYIRLVGQGRYKEALEVIYSRNALPSITGHICDHQCQYNCTRRDYEGALNIRELKRIALAQGWDQYLAQWQHPKLHREARVAVIGAGPAGLSAGYFLARSGFPVTIFEREANAGGVVKNVIPHFRIPAEAISHDIEFVRQHGVNFEFGCDPALTADKLKAQGFKYVILGVGAEKGNRMRLAGDNQQVFESLDFLARFNQGEQLELGRHVAVVGAGNTAMDSARAALKAPGVEKVTIVYRRTENEMPAYQEEYELALADGVQFHFLTNPESFSKDGTLLCRMMELGEPDEQGRRRPVPTDRTGTLQVDSVITAIGEQADSSVLQRMGAPLGDDGWALVDPESCETPVENLFLVGDANTGPSSIVSAMGQARKAANTISEREQVEEHSGPEFEAVDIEAIYQRKGVIPVQLVDGSDIDAFRAQEAQRCLECNYVCSKCTDVCPNRANVTLAMPGFANPFQIIHLDAYCNECGNCAQFCPWEGRPYQDKLTIFSLDEDFSNSSNPGFLLQEGSLKLRHQQEIYNLPLDGKGRVAEVPAGLEEICTMANFIIENHGYLLGEVEV
ncbi:putative selenate reductase subunit YgfK [Dongshaea marina]|uniref:putative selenate reductase subunit YgfK n=1 Tax=Dongshaea marina TaxID=2047966 RepID=UPI000D3E85A5|nr:putative selenate reductase subunit YgfK [Dongshaea marina]